MPTLQISSINDTASVVEAESGDEGNDLRITGGGHQAGSLEERFLGWMRFQGSRRFRVVMVHLPLQNWGHCL